MACYDYVYRKAWQVLEQDIQENGPYDKVEMKYLNDLQKHCKVCEQFELLPAIIPVVTGLFITRKIVVALI